MNAVLGILGCAALFVAFGMVNRGRRPRIGCDGCSAAPGSEQCASCGLKHDFSESSHGTG